MKSYVSVFVAAALLAGPSLALAQKPVSVAEVTTETFTIEAIDHAARVVTLKDKDGLMEDVLCGPEVQRFDALKVGDKVTFRYHESIVSSIHRPGSTPKEPMTGAITRNAGGKPGATIAQQMNLTVTIEAIDAAVPSATVKTADGRRMSFHIADKKNLEGYKVGDKVEFTYTQAVAISVTAAK